MKTSSLKFYYNGIKAGKGKLQRAVYYIGFQNGIRGGAIEITARDDRFSEEVRAEFAVQNNTDVMTDYFERDLIRVLPTHPLYAQVKAAADSAKTKADAKCQYGNGYVSV